MQLLALALYNAAGDRRVIRFRRGLNVITGESATGKSALLEMIEYCLGRNTLTTPVGPIRDTVSWYGLLLQLDHQRAFIGRPAPESGNQTTQRAMLELGTSLDVPTFEHLLVNTDTVTVRDRLGRAIGIDESTTDATGQMAAYEPNLGHATLLCLQRQSEIANRELLFHRQGEEGMARTLQEVLPYFLGAVARDRAVLRQRLLAARRDLRVAEADLAAAERADEDMDVSLQAFLTEARSSGLISDQQILSTTAGLDILRAAVSNPLSVEARDDADAVERARLQRQRDELRSELRRVGEERATLEGLESDESAYQSVVQRQADRLRSLDLLGVDQTGRSDGDSCPMCGSHLAEPDPTVAELRQAAAALQVQAGAFALAPPRRREALDAVETRADELRSAIRSIDEALRAADSAAVQATTGRRYAERQAFLQGRIQRYLETASVRESGELARLRERVRLRQATVTGLEGQLDADDEREQLLSRLISIGEDMTEWADRLQLEHSGARVRLDVRRLTVVADTAAGPAPLNQIGSAANWIGYHLVAHLALHKFFVQQNRPVPRFLALDQPTQAYYPSDVKDANAVLVTDADRAAVQGLFRLMADVVANVDGALQVIVCDHANLPDSWFQDAVIEDWRNGRRLIPDAWLQDSPNDE